MNRQQDTIELVVILFPCATWFNENISHGKTLTVSMFKMIPECFDNSQLGFPAFSLHLVNVTHVNTHPVNLFIQYTLCKKKVDQQIFLFTLLYFLSDEKMRFGQFWKSIFYFLGL